MKGILISIAAAAAFVAGPVMADSGADLLKSKGCLGCHAFDKKKVGPAYKDVAAKYAGKSDAQQRLAAELKEGKGHKKITNASDDELKSMLGAVLEAK